MCMCLRSSVCASLGVPGWVCLCVFVLPCVFVCVSVGVCAYERVCVSWSINSGEYERPCVCVYE